ncbi:hypothetical protein ZWY2020_038822 [Hordeum vulgare]|nr:hypothetical protein ZWY2020_038822 [Hordeum vulgare]
MARESKRQNSSSMDCMVEPEWVTSKLLSTRCHKIRNVPVPPNPLNHGEPGSSARPAPPLVLLRIEGEQGRVLRRGGIAKQSFLLTHKSKRGTALVPSLLRPPPGSDWILSPLPLRSGSEFLSFLLPCVAIGKLLTLILYQAFNEVTAFNEDQPPGATYIFLRLIGKSGLDPGASPPTSPAFCLVLDFERTPQTYRRCSGGGNSLLHVSYHDMILAWAQVPDFCVYGDRGIGSVGTLEVEAKADASVLREEVRNLLWSEIQVVGKVKFDVQGEVAGLGYLRCKFFIMKDKAAHVPKSLCILRQ